MDIATGDPISFTPSDGRWVVVAEHIRDATTRLHRVVGWAVEVLGGRDDDGRVPTRVTTYINDEGHPTSLDCTYRPDRWTCAVYRDDDPDLLAHHTPDEIKRAA